MASDYNLFTIRMHFLWVIVSSAIFLVCATIVRRFVVGCGDSRKKYANSRRLSNFDLIFLFIHFQFNVLLSDSWKIHTNTTARYELHAMAIVQCFSYFLLVSILSGHWISKFPSNISLLKMQSSKGDEKAIFFSIDHWIHFISNWITKHKLYVNLLFGTFFYCISVLSNYDFVTLHGLESIKKEHFIWMVCAW